MKGYMHYVHDIPDGSSTRFRWLGKLRSIDDYRNQFETINELQQAILKDSNEKVLKYVAEHLDLEKYFRHIIFSTPHKSYVDAVDFSNVRAIINFKPINDIKYINEHFRSVNKLLPDAGIYIGKAETYWERKIRIMNKYGSGIGQVIWLVDFALNRIIPKIRPIDKVYRLLHHNKVHPRSRVEILGRLIYNGFDIIEYTNIDNMFYFVVMKTSEPKQDIEPSYHAIIKMKRVGKNGKIINVYKLRTMHPYAEFLQEFVYKLFGYNNVGKPANDFRVARWGKFLRKVWLDELPQIINIFKGEMNLVGVRPLSRMRFNQFPEDLKAERIKYKPGCFPPYVALNMPDDRGNIEAERIYLQEKALHPYTTDLKYFAKAVFNIITGKIRSA
jgi:lipopolysaccharide/colanic/teichoic acid biosynthesis glycosyltransferase